MSFTKVPKYEDDDIQRSLKWFLSFISEQQWKLRKENIKKATEYRAQSTYRNNSLTEMIPISVDDDRIGWYLYLVESLLTDITSYEPIQGARVVPIFKRLGVDFDILTSIHGIEKKIQRLLRQEKSQADSILFEILTALAWAKNGWNVKFIPVNPQLKTPDILAEKGKEQWYIECKRLSKSSTYSVKERDKWLSMLTLIKDDLVKYNFILDVTFHVELHTIKDDYLKDILSGKLQFITMPTVVISNEVCDIHISNVNLKEINNHLEKNYVRNASTQLNYLIGGKKADSTGFSCGIVGDFVTIGGGYYVDRIRSAFGVHWKCDASESINNKARDIWKQLKEAISQFPTTEKSAIHIGIETLDGATVEKERFAKINKRVSMLETGEKNVEWIYCHFFQSYAPPDQTWVIDETIRWFGKENKINPLSLGNFLIIPWGESDDEDNVHWLKPQP